MRPSLREAPITSRPLNTLKAYMLRHMKSKQTKNSWLRWGIARMDWTPIAVLVAAAIWISMMIDDL